MPELPEVETITRQLNTKTSGKKIERAEIFVPKIIKIPSKKFKRLVSGAKIKRTYRRAKLAIFELDNAWSLLFHLKLTGQLIFNGEKNKHTVLIFYFFDKNRLVFNDLRKFGFVKPIKTTELPEFFKKENFGPEPLEKNFTLKVFKNILEQRPRVKIKQFLMDPKNLAGIGNIYSDEILFATGVHPSRPAASLQEKEISEIFKNLKIILRLAVKLRGTSADTYFDAFGQEGKFFQKLKVYGRKGKNCVKCKEKLERIKIGGRSAHFCPKCQK